MAVDTLIIRITGPDTKQAFAELISAAQYDRLNVAITVTAEPGATDMKNTNGLSNTLLGRVLVSSASQLWPDGWRPNATGEICGVIEAAWIEDGTTKVVIRNPVDGAVGEVFLTHHILMAARS